MPRQSGFTVENNFSGAWTTEFHGLNYPPNTVTDTDNCVFERNGKVSHRLGFDFEDSYVNEAITIPQAKSAHKEFVWRSVAGDGAITFVVTQVGHILRFYEVGSADALSDGLKSFTVDLTTYKATGAANSVIQETEAQFDSGQGYLFVAHPLCNPIWIEYDTTGDSITTTAITLQQRDFEGFDDSLDVDERPSTLSDAHKYNLYNQGWDSEVDTAGGGTLEALTYWDNNRSDFPSNADIFWLAKDSSEELDHNYFDRTSFGNSPAPKGHYILDTFNQDRATASGIGGLSSVTSGTSRPSAIAFYAGRVWYAGTAAPGFSTNLYYSQLIKDTSSFGKCYQENDPTSEYLNDLLATDGGVIPIPDVGTVIGLFTYQALLVVMASNGIWTIGGSDAGAFDATNFTVSKISGQKILSNTSFVDIGGSLSWWGNDGIWVLQFDSGTGGLTTSSLTEERIKTYYNENIPDNNKNFVKGYYNPVSNLVYWLYRETLSSDISTGYDYEKVLVLNVKTGQFYKWTIGASTPTVVGVVVTEGLSSVVDEAVVTTIAGESVTDVSDTLVTAEETTQENLGASFRFLTRSLTTGLTYNYTWSQVYRNDYLDWYTHDTTGVSYEGFFDTAYLLRGEGLRLWQNNYIAVACETVTNSSVFIQGRWDFANNQAGNRFSTKQQAYRAKTLRDYQIARLKIRGNGRALHLRFTGEAGKPFTVIGWSMWDTANANV